MTKLTRGNAKSQLIGAVFGRLTVVEPVAGDYRETYWRCACACGGWHTARQSHLKRGNVKSCGCLSREWGCQANLSHGVTKSLEHRVWIQMRYRCTNPKGRGWRNYGGRGITVCARWLESFENFLIDMGACPIGHSLDRKDNDLGYTPENCRWATRRVQANNRRNTRRLTIDGITRPLADWARHAGVSLGVFSTRLDRGWNSTQALTEPTRKLTRRRA